MVLNESVQHYNVEFECTIEIFLHMPTFQKQGHKELADQSNALRWPQCTSQCHFVLRQSLFMNIENLHYHCLNYKFDLKNEYSIHHNVHPHPPPLFLLFSFHDINLEMLYCFFDFFSFSPQDINYHPEANWKSQFWIDFG